jgi:alanine racemase
VDLDAIASNVRAFRAAAPTSELIAVVKGNGYGHGAVPVAVTALGAGAGRLAVYTVDEAAALRVAGITAPVLVFGPVEACEVTTVWSLGLEPTISDLSTLRLLERGGNGGELNVHVKVDTGLTRAGALPRDALALARAISRHPSLRLSSVYTHLARADEPDRTATDQQLWAFDATVTELESQGIRVPYFHAANTAGTLNARESHLNAVRVGIGLYGYDPSRWRKPSAPLKHALSLRSRLTRVTPVPRGCGVGYGHEFRAGENAIIGLVPVGYGDGLPRQLGLGKGRVLVRGTSVPIVGRVSMDQITVDLSKLPGALVGDEVTLIGTNGQAEQSADDLGDQANTICYDILTGLLPRVPRVYLKQGATVGMTRLGRYEPVPSSQ